ncbi:MAG: flagellar hook-associated protein FlgL [bacterium]
MRITNSMISDRVVFNMQRSIRRFLDKQTQISTGRRINVPSDDPIGTQRDLIYRTELKKNEQYRSNISQGQTWLQSYDSILADLKNLVSSAKEIGIAMSNGIYDAVAREGSANEIESIFERLIQLGNSELEGRYMFSGFRTNTEALVASANGVTYAGDQGQIDFQVDATSRMAVNVTAQDVFLSSLTVLGQSADLNVGIISSTLLADLQGGQGVDQAPGTFTITDQNRGIVSTIDISAAIDINDVLTTINAQLAADGITNLQATIGLEKNNLLLDTTPDGLITNVTALNKLNNGTGVDLQPGSILVTDGGAISVEVDLSGAATIGDVVNAFNTQLAAQGVANVTMQINGTGTGLDIIDANGVPLGLSIEEMAVTENTAFGLGILGAVNPTLNGSDLEPTVSFKIDETTGTTAVDLGILGYFSGDFAGADLNPLLQTTASVADLNAGSGFDLSTIAVWQGSDNRLIDLSNPAINTVQDIIDAFNNSGLNITASINPDGTGIQIVNNDTTQSLTIEDVSGGRVAKELGIFGSSDMMGSMLVMVNALRNNDQEGTGLLLQNLDDAMQHLLNRRATVGARALRLEGTQSRLIDLDMSFTKLLSEVEDADISKLITDLATYENSYRASLMASAKIIQPTLLEFLR